MRKRKSRKSSKRVEFVDADEDFLGHAVTYVYERDVKYVWAKKFKYTRKRLVDSIMRGWSEGFGIPSCMLPKVICRNGRRYISPTYSSKTQDWDSNPYIFRTPSYYSVRRRKNDSGNRTN